MKIAIKSKKTANNFLSVAWGTNLTTYAPAKLPATASTVKTANSSHWISTLPRYPTNPEAEIITITRREVPSASFVGTWPTKTRAGTIRNPPTPTRPVRAPTAAASAASPTARPRGTCVMEGLSPVRNCSGQARQPYHRQTRGDGLLGTEAHYIDEDRHREDRSPSA